MLYILCEEDALRVVRVRADGRWEPLRVDGSDEIPLFFHITAQGVATGRFARERFEAGDTAAQGRFWSRIADGTQRVDRRGVSVPLVELLDDTVSSLRSVAGGKGPVPVRVMFRSGITAEARQAFQRYLEDRQFAVSLGRSYSEAVSSGMQRHGGVPSDATLLLLDVAFGDLQLAIVRSRGELAVEVEQSFAGLGRDPRKGILSELIVEKAAVALGLPVLANDAVHKAREVAFVAQQADRLLSQFEHGSLRESIELSNHARTQVVIQEREVQARADEWGRRIRNAVEQAVAGKRTLDWVEVMSPVLWTEELQRALARLVPAGRVHGPRTNLLDLVVYGAVEGTAPLKPSKGQSTPLSNTPPSKPSVPPALNKAPAPPPPPTRPPPPPAPAKSPAPPKPPVPPSPPRPAAPPAPAKPPAPPKPQMPPVPVKPAAPAAPAPTVIGAVKTPVPTPSPSRPKASAPSGRASSTKSDAQAPVIAPPAGVPTKPFWQRGSVITGAIVLLIVLRLLGREETTSPPVSVDPAQPEEAVPEFFPDAEPEPVYDAAAPFPCESSPERDRYAGEGLSLLQCLPQGTLARRQTQNFTVQLTANTRWAFVASCAAGDCADIDLILSDGAGTELASDLSAGAESTLEYTSPSSSAATIGVRMWECENIAGCAFSLRIYAQPQDGPTGDIWSQVQALMDEGDYVRARGVIDGAYWLLPDSISRLRLTVAEACAAENRVRASSGFPALVCPTQ